MTQHESSTNANSFRMSHTVRVDPNPNPNPNPNEGNSLHSCSLGWLPAWYCWRIIADAIIMLRQF